MSHTTPATYLVWSLMATLLGAFLVFHLWKFDRFKCLKLGNGPYTGAFKRLMTVRTSWISPVTVQVVDDVPSPQYTYLLSVPGIIAYAVGFAVIKYKEGFMSLPIYGIIPTPWQFWTPSHKASILPLYLLFTISWSLEMVTHLEELCFWLFLVNSGSVQQDWFRSLYFRTWIVGSIVAVTYMPLVTIFTREDPLKCEAYTFLAGSLGSLSLTLWFMPILWTFPGFIENLKRNGVDTRTVVRLMTFHELNCIRVVFRFIFVVPLLVLAVDGVRPHQHVNESPFWTEFLTSFSGIGCAVSSAITLVIFFPRNVEGEVQSRHATREKSRGSRAAREEYSRFSELDSYMAPTSSAPKRPSIASPTSRDREYPPTLSEDRPYTPMKSLPLGEQSETRSQSPGTTFTPNRRVGAGVVLQGRIVDATPALVPAQLTERALAAHDESMSGVHPFLHNFTSPIDIMNAPPKKWYVKRQHAPLNV
ncbi:hypothetical protein GSI_04284 [Ganoderma sinense ZZ0214-1]|uniref:Uncharacterized protein n=1 Tax=Ganoderma sinense ZZ0214-1 TaxID=1077348 RepID=A0A2G8SIS2_9APHY|nr:hypothetical protein GSI_04284 [Ganoderma sinense ZZ0214-1]